MKRSRRFKIIRNIISLSAISLFLIEGCTKPSINFSSAFATDNSTNIVVVDTFAPLMSTVYYDSFPTSGTGISLVGRYKDNAFGLVNSRTFFQVAPPRLIPNISLQAGYDSLVLITRINKYFYGDTSLPQEYVIKQLKTNIELPYNQSSFYNNDSFPVSNTPLGSATVSINPQAGYTSQLAYDSLKIRLSDATGLELFRMIQSRSDTITNTTIFLGYFKGLSMAAGSTGPAAMYGFKDTLVMRLYYHEPGVVTTPYFTDFIMWNYAFQFNQVTADRTGTPLQDLVTMQSPIPGVPVEIPSAATGNAVYVQPGTAIRAKIKFPSLWQLMQRPDFVSVLKAELDLRPIVGTYSPQRTLPTQLQLFTTDDNNQVGYPVAAAGGIYGNITIDYIYNANTTFTYDITKWIKSEITAGQLRNSIDGLMVTIPPPLDNTGFNRAIFPDQQNPNQDARVVLKIYYASYFIR